MIVQDTGTKVFFDYEVNSTYPWAPASQTNWASSISLIDLPAGHWPRYSAEKLPVGWAGEYSIPNNIGFDEHARLYRDIVEWIHANVDRPYKNAHWVKINDCIYFQLRRKNDFTLFMLRWA